MSCQGGGHNVPPIGQIGLKKTNLKVCCVVSAVDVVKFPVKHHHPVLNTHSSGKETYLNKRWESESESDGFWLIWKNDKSECDFLKTWNLWQAEVVEQFPLQSKEQPEDRHHHHQQQELLILMMSNININNMNNIYMSIKNINIKLGMCLFSLKSLPYCIKNKSIQTFWYFFEKKYDP